MSGVTYIVTIYNKARYLEGVLQALARQEGDFARQFVLVDDGSTDGSAGIAARCIAGWNDARLIRQDNRGPSVAVNRGLAEASMPFTQIVDADDILAPYATKLLIAAARSSGCAAIYGRNTWYGSAADIAFPPEPADIAVTILEDTLFAVIRGGHAGGSTSILDTATFKRVGGCDERVFIQDQSIPQRIAKVARIGLVDHLICMGPRDDPDRLMKNTAQVVHDQSLTALCTLNDGPDLPWRIRRLVQRQVTGRAWKYAARNNGASLLSPFFWLFLAARFPGLRLGDEALATTLDAFRRRNAIRLTAANPSYDGHPAGPAEKAW